MTDLRNPGAKEAALRQILVGYVKPSVTAELAAAQVAAEAARDAAVAATSTVRNYNTLALATADIANIPSAAGVNVLSDGVNNGFYVRDGGALVRKSTATIPGLAAQIAPVRAVFDPQASVSVDARGWGVEMVDPTRPWIAWLALLVNALDGALETNLIRYANQRPSSDRWLWTLETLAGAIGLGLDKAGNVAARLDDASIAHVASKLGAVTALIPDADLPLIGGVKALSGWAGATENTLLSDAYFGYGTVYRQRKSTGAIYPHTSKPPLYISNDGQSLSLGSSGNSGIVDGSIATTPYPEHVYTLADSHKLRGPVANTYSGSGAALGPASEIASGGTPNTGLNAFGRWYERRALRMGIQPRVLIMRGNGAGGRALANLSDGGEAPLWQNSVVQAQTIASLAAAYFGRAAVYGLTIWRHGEQDRVNGLSGADYLAGLTAYFNDIQTKRRAVAFPGQSDPVRMIIVQLAARGLNVEGGASPIAQAQLDFAIAQANATIAAPGYLFEQADTIHRTPRAYNHDNEYAAKAWARWEATAVKPAFCRLLSAAYSATGGHHVDLKFAVPYGRLRNFDTSNGGWLNPHPTYGIGMGSDGGETITGVSIVDRDKVRVSLSAAPTTNRWVSVGYDEGGGNAAATYPYSYSTLCDEDPAESIEFPERGLFNFPASTRMTY